MASGKNHTWTIDEENSALDVVEELEIVEIIFGDPTKVTKARTELPQYKNEGLIKYLKENQDVFAWSYEDMPGIDIAIIQHRLNVDPENKPI